MGSVFGLQVESFLIVLAIIVLVLLGISILLMIRLNQMKNRYNMIMGGKDAISLEHSMVNIQERLSNINHTIDKHEADIKQLRQTMAKMKGNIQILRYNAFSQQGSDLSFSIAFLNEARDGLVLTGIHSREETYLYAKPIQGGKSSYALSPEEVKVINQPLMD